MLRKQVEEYEVHARKLEAHLRTLDAELQGVRAMLSDKEAENQVPILFTHSIFLPASAPR